jgi:hypothetical protein
MAIFRPWRAPSNNRSCASQTSQEDSDRFLVSLSFECELFGADSQILAE